jgi:exonuclease SbcC
VIIRGLQAENLLKYRILRLDELPERGVIAVSGENETGKSAIGEIICFALFGRTYALPAKDLRKLVRWGAIQGGVGMKFSAKDQELEVIRHLYRGGEQSARLVPVGQPEEPVARGVDAVNEHLEQILGYDFDEYIDTFYLAQREITTPHPHSPSVKAMAGITPLELCTAEIAREIEQEEASARRLEEQLTILDGELTQLNPDRLRLGELEQELGHTSEKEQQLATRIAALDAAVDSYCGAHGGLRAHAFRSWLAGFLKALIFLLLLATLGLWAFLILKPEMGYLPAIRHRLEEQITVAGLPPEPTLVYAFIALAGILLLIWLWAFALSLGMRRRRAQGRKLGEELRLVDEMEPLQVSIDTHIDDTALEGGDASLERPALVDKPDSERRIRLAARILALEATPEEVHAAARHEIGWMERGRNQLAGEREVLAQTLAGARADRDRERGLQHRRESLAEHLTDCRERVETRRLACELLEGAARQTADRFNEHLRNLVSRTLPQFTDGRYEYLQVGDDLRVRVYSNEKRSFLDLEEISSGTQRQIKLALRLALAQERMSRIARDRQFAFLDEPFAFFDDTRMRGALRLLPELSDFITQHWVVAQRFPRDEFIALEIPCGGHPDTLEVGMAEASRKQV